MFEIEVRRDDESGMYYVHESDLIGLNACALTVDELVEIIKDVATNLVEANNPRSKYSLRSLFRAFAAKTNSTPGYRVRVSQEVYLTAPHTAVA